jgi:diguanylate cyclase (GGDEF)-like protein
MHGRRMVDARGGQIMNGRSAIRGYFARRGDPFAGSNLGNARRIGVIIWALLIGLAALLVPLNPPDEAIGDAGWVLCVLLIAGGVTTVFQMEAGRFAGWDAMLLVSYGTAVSIGVIQWLSGGQTAPFRGLLLLPVLFVACTQPPRRIAPFMALVFVVLAAPFVYDSWDSTRAEAIGTNFIIWSALAVGASLLMTRVRAQRRSLQEEGQEARAEARIDSLTGLRNRRAFDELLSVEVSRARRHGLSLSMAMVDIENFKEVNDRWSYAEGDRCLRDVADALRVALREPDFCFRWGGDEFALILGGTPADDVAPLAERLREHVSATCQRPDGAPVSIRFAVAELGEGMSLRELTEMAGLALTAGKLDDPALDDEQTRADHQKTNATSST